MGLGWKNSYGTGKGTDTITSGLEGAWTPTPTQWDNSFFDTLFGFEWELGHSPAGAQQWHPKDGAGADLVPDAHDPNDAARADDGDDRPRAAHRPGVPEDLRALPRQPRPARRRLRPGLVQAAPPRHGSGVALPRPVGARAAAVAGPGPGRRPRADRRRRTSPPSRRRSSTSGLSVSQLVPRRGRRRPATATPTSGAAPTAPASASRRRRTGRSTTRPSWPRCSQTLEGIQQEFNGQPAASRSRSPT